MEKIGEQYIKKMEENPYLDELLEDVQIREQKQREMYFNTFNAIDELLINGGVI